MISEVLTAHATRPRASNARRASTLGASDIGQCARKVFYAKRGGERDPGYADRWGATLRGNVLERRFWLPALRARFGAQLKFAGSKQRRFKSVLKQYCAIELLFSQQTSRLPFPARIACAAAGG